MIAVAVFALSAALVLYVVFGYPVLLGVLARWRSRPVHKQFAARGVSIVIPVRNGAPWIRHKLASILALDYPRDLMEIVVVSDESDDGTDDIVRGFESAGVRLMRVAQGGKPAALNAAVPTTRNELLLLTDVRQEVEPGSLRRLVACFADPQVGVVSGELLIRKGELTGERNVGLYWRYESWIRKQLSRIDSMLGATGPFYMLRRELFVHIPPDALLDDVYLPLAAFFRGYRLIVEPAAVAIDYPTNVGTEFRRKVRTLAGNYQMIRYYPALLGPGNRMWLHYVSYKLGRLLLPFALLAAAVSSFWLPSPWSSIAITAQAAFYLLAAADRITPEGSLLKRLSSPAHTFTALMIAAAWALQVFFVSPRKLWTPTRTRAAGTTSHG